MKLLINTASTHQGGAVQVALSFITACKNYPENEYGVILGPKLSQIVDTDSFPDNFCFYITTHRAAQNIGKALLGTTFHPIEKEFLPDVVFTTSGPAYWKSKAPHLIGFNLPHYVYRDSPFFQRIGKWKSLRWDMKGKLLRYFFRRDGDAFVCQTDDVTKRAKQFLGVDKVFTVSNTYNTYYSNYQPQNERVLPESNVFRLLMLSAYHAHKNFEIIPKVLESLREMGETEVEFIVTIKPSDFAIAFGQEKVEGIRNTGPVSIDRCPQLYNEVDAMFLPTLLECFSASYPEAMIMEKPILTSNLGFAKTVCSDTAIYFNPINANEIAQLIIQLKNTPQWGKELVSKGKKRLTYFSNADERARKYLDLCKRLAEGKL